MRSLAFRDMRFSRVGARRSIVLPSLPTPAAVGGTETVITDGGLYYRVHTLTADGVLETSRQITDIELLAVAGGGAGGGGAYGGGAGGGAGQVYAYPAPLTISAGPHAVTIGDGGQDVGTQTGGNGGDTVALGITVKGGGGGAYGGFYDGGIQGNQGGSSGGSSCGFSGVIGTVDGTAELAAGTGYYGNAGGGSEKTSGSNTARTGGGGGGAGSAGAVGLGTISDATGRGGDGGDGVQLSISGVPTYYAGGGAGSARYYGVGGTGGLGGGADGVSGGNGPTVGIDATGYGSGGSGGASANSIRVPGGAGSSGIVVVRYQITQAEYEAAA